MARSMTLEPIQVSENGPLAPGRLCFAAVRCVLTGSDTQWLSVAMKKYPLVAK